MISKNHLLENKRMNKLTWFGVGGYSRYYYQPLSEKDLVTFLKHNDLDLPIYPLGAGSNIIIRDQGFNGVIIHFNKLKDIFIDEKGIITSYCGAMDADVARFARNHSRTGLEFLIGIPGTIGGGIKMNSGAYGSEIKKLFEVEMSEKYNIHRTRINFSNDGIDDFENMALKSMKIIEKKTQGKVKPSSFYG